MGDLHSIAYSSSLNSSSLGWDFHNLGVFNADMFQFMESTPPFVSPLMEPDYSTGYLQDALFEFSSKRRRLLLFSDDEFKDVANPTMGCYENYDCFRQIVTKPCDSISGEPVSTSMTTISEDVSVFTDMKTPEDHQGLSTSEALEYSSSLSSHKDPVINTLSTSGIGEKRKKRMMTTKVVYPFTLVKPGGVEGDITLNDINERILMPPTRPVRHPVGDFACRPLVSPDGPGLFGKSVVALTKIHTQGRGTITIIRTRD